MAGASATTGTPVIPVSPTPGPAGPNTGGDPLLARAVALGFTSVEDLIAGLEEINAQPPAPLPLAPQQPAIQETQIMAIPGAPASPPNAITPAAGAPVAAPGDDLTNNRSLPEHVRKRVNAFRQEMSQKAQAAEAARVAMEQQLAASQQTIATMRAEEQLKLELARAGVQDLDFAWYELKKHIDGMSNDKTPEGAEKLKAFSAQGSAGAKAWADEQRKTRPYLFGEAPVPATTGATTGAAPAPTPMTPGGVTSATAAAGTFDARKASPQEFEARMRAQGIQYNGAKPPPLA